MYFFLLNNVTLFSWNNIVPYCTVSRCNTKNIKNMPAVEKDQNNRAKEHDQNLIKFTVIIQRHSFFTA